MNYLCLDVESTGTNPNKHCITQLAAMLCNDKGEVIAEFNHKCRAVNNIISLGALKVNNQRFSSLRDSQLLGAVKETNVMASETNLIYAFFDWCLDQKVKFKVLGHGTAFDMNFIKAASARANIENVDQLLNFQIQDTRAIAMYLKDCGMIPEGQSTSLGKLAEYFEIPIDGELHDALTDVKTTIVLYNKMCSLIT